MKWGLTGSKKTSQLLAEFREQDSYLNSDFDSDSDFEDEDHPQASSSTHNGNSDGSGKTTRPLLTNSLLNVVDSLLSVAATCARPPGAPPPRLTIRLSRIEESPPGGHEDDRIDRTLQLIRDKGVNVVFGDLSEQSLAPPSPRHLRRTVRPARRINLDPTAMIGLCSDLLHHPLPLNEHEARARFFRPEEHLISSRNGAQGRRIRREDEGSSDAGQSQNSRELVKGLLEEMERPLIQDLIDRLGPLSQDGEAVEFWATEEAVLHVKEALGSEELVGEGMEQRRMRRMIGLEEGDFFEGSRYEGREGCLRGLRVRIFDEDGRYLNKDRLHSNGDKDEVDRNASDSNTRQRGTTSFHRSLANLCNTFLSEYYAHMQDPTSPQAANLPSFLHPRRLPTPKVAQLTRPFTIVSLHSFAKGAEEGMTTLTMGNVVWRDLWSQGRWRVRGWVQGNYEGDDVGGTGEMQGGIRSVESGERGQSAGRGEEGRELNEEQTATKRGQQNQEEELKAAAEAEWVNAVVWLMPYRSLGEGKRVKFEKGDYSYPSKERVGSIKGFDK